MTLKHNSIFTLKGYQCIEFNDKYYGWIAACDEITDVIELYFTANIEMLFHLGLGHSEGSIRKFTSDFEVKLDGLQENQKKVFKELSNALNCADSHVDKLMGTIRNMS